MLLGEFRHDFDLLRDNDWTAPLEGARVLPSAAGIAILPRDLLDALGRHTQTMRDLPKRQLGTFQQLNNSQTVPVVDSRAVARRITLPARLTTRDPIWSRHYILSSAGFD